MRNAPPSRRLPGVRGIPLAGCLALVAVSSVVAVGQEPLPAGIPWLVFDATRVDVGETYELGVIEQEFPFVNRGDRAVRIIEVQTDDPRAVVEHPDRVKPGERAAIRVAQPLEPTRLGARKFRFVVHTDDAVTPVRALDLVTFVQSAYDVEHPFVEFGEVERSRGATRRLEVSSRETEKLAFVGVVDSPDHLQVRPAAADTATSPQTVVLEFTLAPGAPLGFQNGLVHLQTDLAPQRDYFVGYQASVFGDVVAEECPIVWGAVREGAPTERSVRLTSRSGKPLHIARLEDSGRLAASAVEPCPRGGAACRSLRLTLDTARRGGFRGELRVFFEGDDEPLPLSYGGLVASPDALIKDLGVVGEDTVVESYVEDAPDGESRP